MKVQIYNLAISAQLKYGPRDLGLTNHNIGFYINIGDLLFFDNFRSLISKQFQ